MLPPERFFDGEQLALVEALLRDDDQSARRLIMAGAPLNAPARSGMLPLAYLVPAPDPRPLLLALSLGAGPAVPVHPLGTPLALAARMQDPAALRAMLAAGADPNEPLQEPLIHTAGFASAYDAIRTLAAAGADMNAVTAGGDTLLVSALFQDDMALALLALELGCDPNRPNRFGVTARQLAEQTWQEVGQAGQQDTQAGRMIQKVMQALVRQGTPLRPTP